MRADRLALLTADRCPRTDFAAGADGPRTAAEVVAAGALDTMEPGAPGTIIDDFAGFVKSRLSNDQNALSAGMLAGRTEWRLTRRNLFA